MPKVLLTQSEELIYLDPHTEDYSDQEELIEVSDETLQRWQTAIDEFDKVQEEMYSLLNPEE